MTRANITAKISARTTNTANRIDKERELWNIFLNESCKMFEVKEIDVNLTLFPDFITDNFDTTGKGIGDFDGFAICNGNNGTRNRTGRTGVGYGTGYEGVGDLIGSADAVVVAHTHQYSITESNNSANVLAFDSVGDKEGAKYNTVNTTSTGVSGIGKNIPPSIITLMIQRIA